MAKLIVDTETGEIKLCANCDENAPKFAKNNPVEYCGELTSENLQEAVEWFELEWVREQEESLGKS